MSLFEYEGGNKPRVSVKVKHAIRFPLHAHSSVVATAFNKAPISQPWNRHPHAGQQLHQARYHRPPPKWKWNSGTGEPPAHFF